MTRRPAALLATATLFTCLFTGIELAQKVAQVPAPAATPQKNTVKPVVNTAARPVLTNQPVGMPVETQQALVQKYCSGCHNEKLKSGGMSLTQLDLAHPEANPELAEKVIKKLRVGLMPPAGRPRPDAETVKAF